MSDIKQKTKIGIIWNILEKVVGQGIAFVINIILARLLSPNDYGTIAMIALFLTIANVFIDSGFSRALIQKQDRNEYDYSTTLYFNIVTSIILYVILFFASPYIANFYKTPELQNIQRILYLVVILGSFSVVQNAILQINIDFKKLAIINTSTTIISGTIAIACAYKGLEVWALVIQALAKSFLTNVLLWHVSKWRPTTGFSKTSFQKLFGFGSKLLVSGLLSTTIKNIYNITIGRIYNKESLGYYSRAEQFPTLTFGTLDSVLNTTTFPLMASLQNDTTDLISTFKRLIKLTSLIVFPALTGLAILSKPIILVLLGEKWLPAADLLFWLSLSYIFVPLSSLNLNLLNAIGRSDLFLKIDILKTPIIFATMAITFPISIRAIVIGKTVTAFIYFYMNAFMIRKLYKFGALKQLSCCLNYIMATIIMALIIYLFTNSIEINMWSLLLEITVGMAVYFAILLLLKDDETCSFLRGAKARFFH